MAGLGSVLVLLPPFLDMFSSLPGGTALAPRALPLVSFGDFCRRRQFTWGNPQARGERTDGACRWSGPARLEARDRYRVHARTARQLGLREETRKSDSTQVVGKRHHRSGRVDGTLRLHGRRQEDANTMWLQV
jgi:hypothetical protein